MFRIFIMIAFMASGVAKAEFMVRTAPVLLVVGGLNGELDYKVHENISIGAGGLNWSAELLDVEFTVQETHVRADYWFAGTFQEGWYADISYSSIKMDLSTKDIFDKKFEGDISGTAILLGGGYHWQWENFHMELGFQFGNYGFDSDLELEASDGTKEEESIPAGTTAGLEFNLGWVF